MKLTPQLKAWLVEHKGLTAESTDDEFRKAASGAVLDGSLSADKFAELTKDAEAQQGGQLMTALNGITGLLKAQGERIEQLEKAPAAPANPTSTTESTETPETKATPAVAKNAPKLSLFGEGSESNDGTGLEKAFSGGDPISTDPADPVQVRSIGAHERYDTSRKSVNFPDRTERGVKHPFAGQRVFEGGSKGMRYIDEPSELEQAINGAYVKFAIRSEKGGNHGIPAALRMTEHDEELIKFALQNHKWGGVVGGVGSEDENAIGLKGVKLTPHMQKAVLDDATSGGLEAAPIMFDDQIILTPLLNGEFFPRVNTVNITRGRRIEGASMGNVTFSSGGADGTAIPLFSTSGFIAAFDTTIFVANGSIELGMDFLSDSPVDIAGMITQTYGQQLLTWLDEQVVVGDGSTEPEGIMSASGTTSVSSANGASGPPTVGDYEGLLFGVPKAYKQGFPVNRIAYGANETTYQRARGIAVGASDQRRVFGMNQEDYNVFGHPYGISESFTNAQALFANFARYRMYRRLGLTLKVTTEGKELVRNNFMLLTARARYGGQLEDGAAAAVITDMQS